MSVCSANTESSATIQASYNTAYPGTSCLPSSGNGWTGSTVDSGSGLVSTNTVDTWVAELVAANAVAPGTNMDVTGNNLSQTQLNSASTFASSSAALRTKIDSEYCYYYVRYNWALSTLLTRAVNTGTDFNGSSFLELKTNTETLNRKLNQIIQVLQSLVNNRLQTLHTYYGQGSGVNKLNDDLNSIRAKLQSDSKALNDSQMQTNIKTAAMDYTIEKNNSSRNLLAVYGFLNIVAIGTIYYLYRNMKS